MEKRQPEDQSPQPGLPGLVPTWYHPRLPLLARMCYPGQPPTTPAPSPFPCRSKAPVSFFGPVLGILSSPLRPGSRFSAPEPHPPWAYLSPSSLLYSFLFFLPLLFPFSSLWPSSLGICHASFLRVLFALSAQSQLLGLPNSWAHPSRCPSPQGPQGPHESVNHPRGLSAASAVPAHQVGAEAVRC